MWEEFFLLEWGTLLEGGGENLAFKTGWFYRLISQRRIYLDATARRKTESFCSEVLMNQEFKFRKVYCFLHFKMGWEEAHMVITSQFLVWSVLFRCEVRKEIKCDFYLVYFLLKYLNTVSLVITTLMGDNLTFCSFV